MRKALVLSVVLGAFALSACSVEVKVKLPHRYNGTEQQKLADADYAGEQIQINNRNGAVEIIGDSSVTKVTAAVRPFALAEEGLPQSDVDAAHTDIYNSLTITESSGSVTVSCGQASSHGKIQSGNTGCALTVRVPADGVKLAVLNQNGGIDVKGLSAADGEQLDIQTENGSVDAVVTGGARIVSMNGGVTVSATPTVGSKLEVGTDNGDIELALPSNFAADALSLSAGKGVKIEGFSDITGSSTSRGEKGAGAASITAKASSLGELLLKSR